MQIFDPKDQNFCTIQVTQPVAIHPRLQARYRWLSGDEC